MRSTLDKHLCDTLLNHFPKQWYWDPTQEDTKTLNSPQPELS